MKRSSLLDSKEKSLTKSKIHHTASINDIYRYTERAFERLTSVATGILSNSITFLVALVTVIFWLTNKRFYTQDIHAAIGDVILGVTFLTLFIIQKSFVHFSASLHLKINELVASHTPAS